MAQLVAEVPPAVVTVTSTWPGPCAGAVAVSRVSSSATNAAGTAPNRTTVAAARCVPVISTTVPPTVRPWWSAIDVTTGAGARGVTAADGADAAPTPTAFRARTVNVTGVPFARPVTVIGPAAASIVRPPGVTVTV